MWREKPLRGSKTQELHYPKKSKLQSTRTHKTYCSSHTFNYNTKPMVNVSQPSLILEGVFDGFLYLKADP
jgi:hypothetical protein